MKKGENEGRTKMKVEKSKVSKESKQKKINEEVRKGRKTKVISEIHLGTQSETEGNDDTEKAPKGLRKDKARSEEKGQGREQNGRKTGENGQKNGGCVINCFPKMPFLLSF